MERPNSSENNTKNDNNKFFSPLLDNNNNMNKVLTINTKKIGYIFNISGFTLENNYTLENALEILLTNLLTKEAIRDKEIGMDDNDLFTGLEIINRINENKNIILKFFDFFPDGIFAEDYFSIKKPNYEKFLDDIKIDDVLYKNTLIIIPLNIINHFSLLLIYNKKTYILDFGLLLLVNEKSIELKENINCFDNEITKYINNKKYDYNEIWKIIDHNESINDITDKLREIIKDEDQEEFFELLKKYKSAYDKLDNIKILEGNIRLDSDIFRNENFIKNIHILNQFCIQGSQGCGYFCLAAFKNYN